MAIYEKGWAVEDHGNDPFLLSRPPSRPPSRRPAVIEDDPSFHLLLNDLADLYHLQGRYDEAESLYQRSLSIRKRNPYLVTRSLTSLGNLYRDQERYSEAESLYKHALDIYEKTSRKNNPDVANSLNNLAELYRLQERYDEAEPLYQLSLAIYEKALTKDSTVYPYTFKKYVSLYHSTLNNLAELYRSQGRYDEAESLIQRIQKTVNR